MELCGKTVPLMTRNVAGRGMKPYPVNKYCKSTKALPSKCEYDSDKGKKKKTDGRNIAQVAGETLSLNTTDLSAICYIQVDWVRV